MSYDHKPVQPRPAVVIASELAQRIGDPLANEAAHLIRDMIVEMKRLVLLTPPMTPAEADKAYDEAVPVPISEEQINRIIERVTGKKQPAEQQP